MLGGVPEDVLDALCPILINATGPDESCISTEMTEALSPNLIMAKKSGATSRDDVFFTQSCWKSSERKLF